MTRWSSTSRLAGSLHSTPRISSKEHAGQEAHLFETLVRSGARDPSRAERWRTALTLVLYAGELDHAREIVRAASEDMPVVSMLDDVLAPAMHNIGMLWELNDITIADEHLATFVAHRLLGEVALALMVAAPGTRPRVLLATPPDERHTFGLMMANDVLYGAGYETVMLGPGVPDQDLSAALVRHQPSIVALSSTMPGADALRTTAKVVRHTVPDARLLTGGAAAQMLDPDIPTQHVARLDGLLDATEALLAA